MSDLLHDTKLDGLQQEFVQSIRSSGDALLEIINAILDYSKIESQVISSSRSSNLTSACWPRT